MKLSKRDALRKCKKMWQWLADNPSSSKDEYFTAHGIAVKPQQMCYTCQHADYDNLEAFRACPNCLLLPLWLGKRKKIYDTIAHSAICVNAPGSPFAIWSSIFESESEKERAAQKIADYCEKRLIELGYNKGK